MTIYLSMQRVRFSSPAAYDNFKVLFADTHRHLVQLPGFLHLSWWEHPDDKSRDDEFSMWTSRGALCEWHKDTYHKHCKAWASKVSWDLKALQEAIVTNFELAGTRRLRVCPVCDHLQDKKYDLAMEQEVVREQCPQCLFHCPVLEETPSSFAVFDVPSASVKSKEAVDENGGA
ncbi:hypothetical protein AC578_3751 [Pseudocercospora eumusae]|uniref:ABM domain-containing protein n=1 Tax=Pseudocercospora eumusae TaxID=321146 RepID=A0A139HSX2_9PEZI|nr:hypothetical protein AC578_3751 [Pseudocercospora eumusae]